MNDNDMNVDVNIDSGNNTGVMYSQEDLEKAIKLAKQEALKEAQSDIDRKITTALKTREENLQSKYKTEKESLMSEKATAEEQIKTLMDEINAIKRDNAIKDNRLDIERQFSNSGFGGEHLNSILDNIITEDKEKSLNTANAILNLINSEKTKLNDDYNNKLTNIPKPQQTNDNTMTKAQFDKLTPVEMIEFMKTNPQIASKFMNGDI